MINEQTIPWGLVPPLTHSQRSEEGLFLHIAAGGMDKGVFIIIINEKGDKIKPGPIEMSLKAIKAF